MNKDKSIMPKKENKKEGVVGEKWDITWEGVDIKTKMVCDKTKELTIPILLSAFYSTHINLLTSTTSHFTLPRLFISHDLLFLLHIFSDFLSNMRLCPFL